MPAAMLAGESERQRGPGDGDDQLRARFLELVEVSGVDIGLHPGRVDGVMRETQLESRKRAPIKNVVARGIQLLA